MFPALKVDVIDLDPDKKYLLIVDFLLADNCRYKFQNDEWVEAGAAFPQVAQRRMFVHPDSPSLGSHWMSKPVSFHELKLTNNLCDEQNHVRNGAKIRYFCAKFQRARRGPRGGVVILARGAERESNWRTCGSTSRCDRFSFA